MTEAARSSKGNSQTQGRHSARLTERQRTDAVGALAWTSLIAALGVFVVAVADTTSRLGYSASPWPDRAYWVGQALVVSPVAFRLTSRKGLEEFGTVALIIVLTLAEYIILVCYSPLAFTFGDELFHWRGTVNLLTTGRIFTANYGLPISPHYPGLEVLTASVVSVTRLSVFTSGLIVAGVAHLAFICLLYLFYRNITKSYRIAGISALIYSTVPTLTSFNSMFVYETLAMPFLALALLATLRAGRARTTVGRLQWISLSIVAILVTTVTHHVTSYVLAGALVIVALVSLSNRQTPSRATLTGIALFALAAIAGWIFFVAPDTITYFRPTVSGISAGLSSARTGGPSGAHSIVAAPFGDRVLEAAAIGIVSILIPVAWWRLRGRYREDPWLAAAAIGAAAWYVCLAVRVGVPDGQELAGRFAVYAFIPVSAIIALGVANLLSAARARRWATVIVGATLVGVALLFFDGQSNGWPPYYERLPGPYEVGAFERSVTPQGVAAARWALSQLGSGNGFAADTGNYPLLAGYGDQNVIGGTSYLYDSPDYTQGDRRRAAAQGVQYVLVDHRLSESLPESGAYFPDDTGDYKRPLAATDLGKFNDTEGVARIYDNGPISIYDIEEP